MTRRLLAAALILIATSAVAVWYQVRVRYPVGIRSYAVSFGDAAWLRAPGSGPRAWFRTQIDLPAKPDAAVIWVDADQSVTVYADGLRVRSDEPTVNQDADTPPERPRIVLPVDLEPVLRAGPNTIALEVENSDGRAPAFRARLTVVSAGQSQIAMSSAQQWRATSDVSLVRPPTNLDHLPFSAVGFDDVDWDQAQATAARHGSTASDTPMAVLETPELGNVFESDPPTADLVATTSVSLRRAPSDGWIRVAADGPFSVFVNGAPVLDEPNAFTRAGTPDEGSSASLGVRSTRLALLDVGTLFHPGSNSLTVHVHAPTEAMLYVDGQIDSSSRHPVGVPDAGSWQISGGAGGVLQTTPRLLGPPSLVLAAPLLPGQVGQALSVPSTLVHHTVVVVVLEVVLLWILSLLVIWLVADSPLAQGACLAAAGLMPALGLSVLLLEVHHLDEIHGGFPALPGVWRLLAAVAVFGELAVIAVGARARRAGRAAWVPAASLVATRPRLGDDRPEDDAAPEVVAQSALGRNRSAVRERSRYALAAVVGIAFTCGVLNAYQLGYEPFWQDELSSVAAAQGMRAHLLPVWPSGFYYFKSELYSAMIAVVGAIFGDHPVPLRMLSVVLFVGTVLAFGLLLMPLVLPRSRVAQVAATAIWATAPPVIAHARDVRMYQLVQLLAICFVVAFWRALHDPTTRRIFLAALLLVAMYFAHEESFCLLPVVPLATLGVMRLKWVKNWRWWAAGAIAAGCIGVQLVATKLSHPPIFGIDHSNGALVQYSPSPFYYLNNYLFSTNTAGPVLSVVTLLAIIATVMGIRRRDPLRPYLAACVVVPLVVLSLALPTKSVRYAFITMPFLAALAACGFVDATRLLRDALFDGFGRRLGWLVTVAAVPASLAVALTLTGGIADYGLAVARLTGANISHRHLDFDNVMQYVDTHIRPGDVVIAAAPANLVGEYLGRAPDYWMPYRRDERLLYLFEKGGQAVDTQYGVPTILDGDDLQRVLDDHQRVWLVTAPQVYMPSFLPQQRALIGSYFHLVSEDESTAAYVSSS